MRIFFLSLHKYRLLTLLTLGVLLFCFYPFFNARAQDLDFSVSEEIKDLNKEIEQKNQKIKDLNNQAGEYSQVIKQKQGEALTLQNELAIIANRIKKIELDIARKGEEIDRTNLQIEETQLQIKDKESQINFQKAQLGSLLREINREDQRGNLEVLLLYDNLSKYFAYVNRLEEIQQNLGLALKGVTRAKRDLDIAVHNLETAKFDLQTKALEAEIDKQKLEEEKQSNTILVEQTQLSESKFQQRLSEIRFQQRVANEQIVALQADIKEKLRQAQLNRPGMQLNPGQLIWPVPNQGITTYFHDPSYPFRNIVGEHSGLDLRTLIAGSPSMGLSVKSAADGIVVKTIRNGRFTGNAIFVSHGNLMTVYYHLSEIRVSAEEVVEIGKTIGLSGGAPGHPGAGLSSGPHLHFEVRKDGVPVNPCTYLQPNC